MNAFLLRRLTGGLVLIAVVSTMTFFLLALLGRDPAAIVLGQNATPDQIAVKRAELGLDEPLVSRFLGWVGGALTGDLGVSWANNTPVTDALVTRVPITLALCVGATLLSALLGGSSEQPQRRGADGPTARFSCSRSSGSPFPASGSPRC